MARKIGKMGGKRMKEGDLTSWGGGNRGGKSRRKWKRCGEAGEGEEGRGKGLWGGGEGRSWWWRKKVGGDVFFFFSFYLLLISYFLMFLVSVFKMNLTYVLL